jgi:hypothetical protein
MAKKTKKAKSLKFPTSFYLVEMESFYADDRNYSVVPAKDFDTGGYTDGTRFVGPIELPADAIVYKVVVHHDFDIDES